MKFSSPIISEVKKLVNKDKWYEFTGYINNGTDNNIYIYGAPGLMYLDGLKDLQISNLAISNATKIVEIDCRGSRHLNQLQFLDNITLNLSLVLLVLIVAMLHLYLQKKALTLIRFWKLLF